MRQACFGLRADGAFDHWTHISGCDNAELIQRNGYLVQKGGPPQTRDNLCKRKTLSFVMPYEMNFVLNFTIGEHHLPTGKILKLVDPELIVPDLLRWFHLSKFDAMQWEGFQG